MEEQIREKVKVSAVCDQDSLKFERREGKEQHCYTSITKTCQTQRTSLETSTYPSPSPQFKTFHIWDYSEIVKNHSRRISTFSSTLRGFSIHTSTQHIFSLSLSKAIFLSLLILNGQLYCIFWITSTVICTFAHLKYVSWKMITNK